MLTALLLGLLGIALSAFFSGAETGFYRVTRLRLLLDAMSGDRIARGLSWLSNHPTFFVATTLVGNNLANYLTSLAIVLAAQVVSGAGNYWFEIVAPIALSPVLFIYGELLPKYLFFHSPHQLLRRAGPLFLVATFVFLPLSVLLWVVSMFLERVMGASPQRTLSNLARRELQMALDEGHEAGVLLPTQRQLAQGLFVVANRSVIQFARPTARIVQVRREMSKAEVLRLAQRHRRALLPVAAEKASAGWSGYVRVAELALATGSSLEPIHPLIEIDANASHLAALTRMHAEGERIAQLVDRQGQSKGLVFIDDLHEPLFRGGR